MSDEIKNGIPSDEEIAREAFRVYKVKQKKYYKNLMKTYSFWTKISTVLISACFILFAMSRQTFFIWMSIAYLIVGILAMSAMAFMREMYHRVYKLDAFQDVNTEHLDSSLCIRKGKEYVSYNGRKYPRVGCMPDNREPGFMLVSCEDYAYIVEIMHPPEKEKGC